MTSQFLINTLNPDEDHSRLIEISDGDYNTLNDLKDSFSRFRGREYRKTQSIALDFIINSTKKFIVIEAPTGAGKSLIGMASGQIAKSSIYTVHSKPLQVQLNQDFPEATVLFGRGNYQCTMSAKFTCAECPLLNPKETCTTGCPYKAEKQKALASKFRVLNYSYLLTEMNFVGQFSKQGLVVIDEADALEGVLYNFVSISISESRLRSMNLTFPKHKTASSEVLLQEWKDWAIGVKKKVDNKVRQMSDTIKTWEEIQTDDERRYVKQLESLQGLQSRLAIFITHVDQSWQSEIKEGLRGDKVIHFKPLWLTPDLTESALWRHSERFLLMSGTFPPLNVLGRVLGVDPSQIDYLTLPSTFPVENRRCIIAPIANITHQTQEEEVPKLVKAVRKILQIHDGQKGLIHVVNYRLRDALMNSISDPRLITHDGMNKMEIIDAFRASDQPLVLVSPSSERGLSLEDALCRFIILCKMPFLSLADKSVKQRLYGSQVGKIWYEADALLTVCQACGRGVRHENDQCVSYLLDFQIYRIIAKKPSLLPPWFRDALTPEDTQELLGMERWTEPERSALDNDW